MLCFVLINSLFFFKHVGLSLSAVCLLFCLLFSVFIFSVCVHLCACACKFMHTCVCVCVCIYVCACVCVCLCVVFNNFCCCSPDLGDFPARAPQTVQPKIFLKMPPDMQKFVFGAESVHYLREVSSCTLFRHLASWSICDPQKPFHVILAQHDHCCLEVTLHDSRPFFCH